MLGEAGYSTPKCLSVQAGVHGGIAHASVWKAISLSTGEKGGCGSESQSDQ